MGANLKQGATGTFWKINSKGYFYRSSKEDMSSEGWKEITLENGEKRWHQEANSISGVLSAVDVREFESGNQKFTYLQVSLSDEGEFFHINIPFKKFNGGIHDYIKSIVCVMDNLPTDRALTFYPSKKQDDEGYVNKTIYITEVGDESNSLFPLAHSYKSEKNPDGDIPAVVMTESFDGKRSYDFKEQDKYVYKLLMESIEKLKQGSTNTTTSTSESSSTTSTSTSTKATTSKAKTSGKPKEAASDSASSEEDDLPF